MRSSPWASPLWVRPPRPNFICDAKRRHPCGGVAAWLFRECWLDAAWRPQGRVRTARYPQGDEANSRHPQGALWRLKWCGVWGFPGCIRPTPARTDKGCNDAGHIDDPEGPYRIRTDDEARQGRRLRDDLPARNDEVALHERRAHGQRLLRGGRRLLVHGGNLGHPSLQRVPQLPQGRPRRRGRPPRPERLDRR